MRSHSVLILHYCTGYVSGNPSALSVCVPSDQKKKRCAPSPQFFYGQASRTKLILWQIHQWLLFRGCRCVRQENCASFWGYSGKQLIPFLRLPNKQFKHVHFVHWTALRAAV
jgi:hypothetical protein